MPLFKEKLRIEDFCLNFYNNNVFNTTTDDNYYDTVLPQHIMNNVELISSNVNKQNIIEESIALQIELLGLVCTHKFISGETIIRQNIFTKNYLIENNKSEIWDSMYDYNDIIGITTLDWLTTLGSVNINFNHQMRKDLIAKNNEEAKKLGLTDDEVIERVNNQVWSESAWRQKFMLSSLARTFWSHLGLDLDKLDKKTTSFLASLPLRLYKEAQQYLNQVKVKN